MRLARFIVTFILTFMMLGGIAATAGFMYGGSHKQALDETMRISDRAEEDLAGKLRKAAEGWGRDLPTNVFQVDRYAFVVNENERMLGIVPQVRLQAENLDEFKEKSAGSPQIVGMLLSDLSILMDPKTDRKTGEPNPAERKFLVYYQNGKCHFGDVHGNVYAESPAEISEKVLEAAGMYFNPNNTAVSVDEGAIHLTYEVRLGENGSPRYAVVETVVPDGVWVAK